MVCVRPAGVEPARPAKGAGASTRHVSQIPSRTLDTTKCARQDLNLHARIGHPGLSRARLPDFRHERGCHHCVVLKVRTGQCCSPVSSRCTRTSRVRCCKHVATHNVGCRALISATSVVLQRNWMHQTTGMSGDVPGRENSEAEIFMRVFFGPLLPAGAHAH